jgi:heme-degrading monooxygenase HmoA
MFVTIVEGRLEPAQEADLRSAWEEAANNATRPPGFIESSLIRSEDGTWRVVTVWESQEAVLAMRASGEKPAAPAMFERAGAAPSLTTWTVEGRIDVSRR